MDTNQIIPTEQPEKSIWQLQEELRQWHDSEYVKAYPSSRFTTGRDMAEKGKRAWEELTPVEQERKERVAYMLNNMLFGLGVNVSGSFAEPKAVKQQAERTYNELELEELERHPF